MASSPGALRSARIESREIDCDLAWPVARVLMEASLIRWRSGGGARPKVPKTNWRRRESILQAYRAADDAILNVLVN